MSGKLYRLFPSSKLERYVKEEDSSSIMIAFDPRGIGKFGDSVSVVECDLPQEATQYKQAHSLEMFLKRSIK